MNLVIEDKNGKLTDALEGLEEYDLTTPAAQKAVALKILDVIERYSDLLAEYNEPLSA